MTKRIIETREIKAILFDMDGVLVDARDWHYEALNCSLVPFGAEIDRREHLAEFDGLPTRVKLEMLTARKRVPAYLHQLISEQKQRYTLELLWRNCCPVIEHQFLLQRLKKLGLKLAICSNSVRETVDLVARLANLGPFMDLRLANEDVVDPKPAPDIYFKAMETLNVLPHQSIIIEDNPNGIRAARASGAFVFEVTDPSQVSIENLALFARENDLDLFQ